MDICGIVRDLWDVRGPLIHTLLPNGDWLFVADHTPDSIARMNDTEIMNIIGGGTCPHMNENLTYVLTAPIPGIPLLEHIKRGGFIDIDRLQQNYTNLIRTLDKYNIMVAPKISDFNIAHGRLFVNSPFNFANTFNYEIFISDKPTGDKFRADLIDSVARFASRKFILNNPRFPYNRQQLSSSDVLRTWPEILLSTLPNATGEWDWDTITGMVPMRFIREHPELDWDADTVRMREMRESWGPVEDDTYTDFVYVDLARQQGQLEPWHEGVSLYDVIYGRGTRFEVNPGGLGSIIPIEQIRARSDIQWPRLILSRKPGIRMSDLSMENATGTWNYSLLSSNLPMEDIRAHPHLPWNREYLSKNPEITYNDVLSLSMPNAIGEWNMIDLSANLPMDDIRANPQDAWNLYHLSDNYELTNRDITYLELPNAIDEWNADELGDRASYIRTHPPLIINL